MIKNIRRSPIAAIRTVLKTVTLRGSWVRVPPPPPDVIIKTNAMDKKIVSLAIVVVVALASVLVFFNYRNQVSNNNQIEENTQSAKTQIEDKKITEEGKGYTIDAAYPYIEGEVDFNAKAKAIVDTEIVEFKKMAAGRDVQMDLAHDLNISYAKDQPNEDIVSIVFSMYNYSGGAHGNGYYASLTYNVKDDKEIKLADVFASQADYLQKISVYVKADLEKAIIEKGGNVATSFLNEGASPEEKNFSNFMLHNNSITFYFPPYQVAAYVYGSFEVTMPLAN